MPLDEEAVNSAFKFPNGLDDRPIQEVAPSNMPLCEEAAITAFEFVNSLDDTPIQMEKKICATERDDSLPEDMMIRKEPVLIECFNGYQFGN